MCRKLKPPGGGGGGVSGMMGVPVSSCDKVCKVVCISQ